MSETNIQEQAPGIATPPINFKLTPAEIYAQLTAYTAQADKTLQQLQASVDAGTNQLNEWRKMIVMITSQKAMAEDLINKMVVKDAPPADTAAK